MEFRAQLDIAKKNEKDNWRIILNLSSSIVIEIYIHSNFYGVQLKLKDSAVSDRNCFAQISYHRPINRIYCENDSRDR